MEFRFVVILAIAMWVITDSHGQTPPRPAPSSTQGQDPSRLLKLYLDAETTGLAGRVEVVVGNIDERLRLAPCSNMMPFIPAGARLWGRTMLGIRCQDNAPGAPGSNGGAAWSVLIPVEIKVFGQALVAARPLTFGETPGMDNLILQEMELTREAPGALNDPAQIGDSMLTRNLNAGQTLRREHLRGRPVVVMGDMVKLVATGAGFAVSSYGKALSAGADGQLVRVQADSGRTLSGIARAGKVVEVRL